MTRTGWFALAVAISALSAPAGADTTGEDAPAFATGRNLAPSLNHQVLALTPAYRNPGLQRYVRAIAHKVAVAMNIIEQRPLADDVQITVLDIESRNAFALGDRLVFLDRGLLPFLDSEAELAAVVAIELAHLSSHGNFFAAVGDHEWQAERTLGQVASSIASIGALFSPRAWMEGNPLSPAYPDEHGAIARAVTAARQGASRASELRAVTRATAYLAQAGYSTAALPAALHNLRRAKSPDCGPSTPALSTVNYHAERALGAQPFGVSAGDPGANLDAFSSAIRAGHKLFRERTNRGQRASDDSRHHPAQDHPRVGTVNREGFLAQLEGTILGPPVHEGVVRGQRFYHRGLAISLACPPCGRWQTSRPTCCA